MLKAKIYYRLKPFIPTRGRIALRKWIAARTRARSTVSWPIMPGSELPPPGWTGWPDGKQFALVLTHDVEGPGGLEKCRALMELELGLGFRSSFNFIPEGSYRIPDSLRHELSDAGFEVGVHDLRHDGLLFTSRRRFAQSAGRINHYIKEWGASGFRSGFMLHNLDWLHELQIQYDASTFDTDPFEPQPEGRHTIFPFWVAPPGTPNGEKSANGYVELPYTLPQDSTLFLVLEERTPDIWLRKTDWIAEHGGMVLLDTHPDYMSFNGRARRGEFDVSLYRDFLETVRRKYQGRFWQPLPREVARFVREANRPALVRPARPRRVCMVTYSFYTSDNRVMRYAEALAARGDHVEVLGLRRSSDLPKQEVIHGVRLFRIRDRFEKSERSQLSYLIPLLKFLAAASSRITWRHARKPYDILHIHNIPDFLVFAAWLPKLTRARIILDIHDIVPEFFVSKFGQQRETLMFRLLKWMERASARFADHVIIANHLWLENYASRTGTKNRCTPFINNVDSRLFKARERKRKDGRHIILFPGGLQWHQGVDIALRAFHRLRQRLPTAEFHIYGDGIAKSALVELADELSLNGSVQFFPTTSVRDIARIMAEADLGVVPKRADSFGNEAYSTKIMEFMSVGVPVVVSNTKVDRYYFNDSVVRFFDSGNDEALADAMFEMLTDGEKRQRNVERALEYVRRNNWETCKADYLRLVDTLCGEPVRP